LIYVRNEKLISCSGYCHIYKPGQLFLGPSSGFQKVQAQQEHHRIIEPFDAVDGGYGDAVGGDVVGFF
jgi:hypothetical protein